MRHKDGRPGNSPVDALWLEEHAEELTVIEPDRNGETPFRARLQWNGLPETRGSPWQIPPPEDRCLGQAFVRDINGLYILDAAGARLHRRCWRWRIPGGTVCLSHGGSIGAVRNRANLRLLEASDTVIGHLIALAVSNKVPARDRISAINSILDRAGIKAGPDLAEVLVPWEGLLREWMTKDRPGAQDDDDEGDS